MDKVMNKKHKNIKIVPTPDFIYSNSIFICALRFINKVIRLFVE